MNVIRGWRGWGIVLVVWLAYISLIPPVAPLYQRALIALAVASQLLPLFAVVELSRPVPKARLWIAIWALAFFVSDLIQLALVNLTQGQTLWFYSIINPIEDAALLMAFSYWQLRPVMRLSFRVAIPLLAIVTFAIALTYGELATFKSTSSPFRLLVITTGVAYTLVMRTSREEHRIWERDWLWASLGVILYYAAYVVVDPVSAALVPERMDLARLVYVVKAGVDTVAYLMVWKGMRCVVEPASSGSMSAPSWQSV